MSIIKDVDPDTYIGLGLPLEHNEGFFPRTKRIADQAQYNLINLLRTHRGDRLGNPEFGSDLWRMLFEPDENIGDSIEEEVRSVVTAFLPYIEITNIETNFTGRNTINLHITYNLSTGAAASGVIDLQFQKTLNENMSITDDEEQVVGIWT